MSPLYLHPIFLHSPTVPFTFQITHRVQHHAPIQIRNLNPSANSTERAPSTDPTYLQPRQSLNRNLEPRSTDSRSHAASWTMIDVAVRVVTGPQSFQMHDSPIDSRLLHRPIRISHNIPRNFNGSSDVDGYRSRGSRDIRSPNSLRAARNRLDLSWIRLSGSTIGRARKVRVPTLSKRSMSVDRQRGTELLSAGSMKPAIARNCLELAQSNYPHSVCTRVY